MTAFKKNPTILISCGENSGDLHASQLVRELRLRFPESRILARGGEKVAAAGAEILYHIDDFPFIGFSDVLTNLPKLVRLERGMKRALEERVDLFIPVDYPGMNLRLAAHAKKFGIPVLYYISPQVWAWGKQRIRQMARSVDFVAAILPFEEKILREEGIPVEFVGHPLVEDHPMPAPRDQEHRFGVGLLPGSRVQEVRRILPVLLDTARRIHRERPNERFAIGMSSSVPRSVYERIVRERDLEVDLTQSTLEVMARSRLLLVASGTATLEGALLETPLIVVYRLSKLNYWIAKRLVKIDDIGLVNIILGERICPEFVQVNANPTHIAGEALSLLDDHGSRDSMITKFGELRTMLSGRGGCKRVAEISQELLNTT